MNTTTYRLAGQRTWRPCTIVSTTRGETDVWYTVLDSATQVTVTVPWHQVRLPLRVVKP